jgi:hypothetical protein
MLGLWGCEQSVEVSDPGGMHLLHEFGGGFWEAPLPSDHRRHADGTVDIGGFPNPEGIPFVDQMVGLTDGQLGGAGTSSTVYFSAEGAFDPASLPDVHASVLADSQVFVIGVQPGSGDFGVRIPIDVTWLEDGGPFGADDMLALLPLQGRPMLASTRYAAVVMRDLGDDSGERLGPAPLEAMPDSYEPGLAVLPLLGIDVTEIAGLAVFTTQDPTAGTRTLAEAAATEALEFSQPFELTDEFDEFCVFQAVVAMPVYQAGEPPYLTGGGGIALDGDGSPVLQRFEDANLVITLPREEPPEGGWPVTVFIRTGGGGERPLVDRGVRDASGEVLEPGTGPALQITRAGIAGVSVDGPHGGLRNVSGGDEQFLIFNVTNPEAMRDNIRQSAAELALLPELLAGMSVDASACEGIGGEVTFQTERMVLMGHSMGATIAPLVLAVQSRYDAVVLSGAGGSWIHNIVYKLSPLEVRPLAEVLLQYDGRTLTPDDPALMLLQWSGESADPPVYARGVGVHTLMIQGIVDTYILPPMANATTVSLGLDLGGEPLDAGHPELAQFRPIEELLPLVGRGRVELPVEGNLVGGFTGVVTQHLEDGVEDGHEVFFQTEGAKGQYGDFLEAWVTGTPRVATAHGSEVP